MAGRLVDDFSTTTGASSYSSDVPAAGSETETHLVWVFNTHGTDATLPTLSGGGLSWTEHATVVFGGSRATLFRARGTNTAAAVTASFGGTTQTGCIIIWGAWTEIDPTTDQGIRQVALANLGSGNPGSVADGTPFGSAIEAGNVVASGAMSGLNAAVAAKDPPFTEMSDVGYGTPATRGHLQAGVTTDADPEHTASGSTYWRIIAVELKTVTAGGTTHDLAAVAIGEGAAAGDLSRILALEGWALGEGVGAGELSRILALEGLAVGEGAATGTLDVPVSAPPAPVAFPRRPSPAPTYPEWSFTIDKRPVVIGGWQLEVDEFGPREASGMVDEDTARRIRPGSRLVGFVNGEPRWDGMIPKRPVVYQGVAAINAFGWQFLAAEHRERYLAQTRDYSQFSPSDGDPYNRVVSSQALQAKFDLQERAGSLQFRLGDGETFGTNEAHAFMMNARGSPGKITRYAFDWVTAGLNYCEFRTYGWDWLNTNALAINTATLGGATSGTMANTFAGRDQLEIQLATNNVFTLGQAWDALIRNLRVNGRTTGDIWATSAIVADFCSILDIDSSLVEASPLNALPFDQIGGSALDAMAHMAYLDDRPAPFIGGDGDAIWCAYHAWDRQTWTVHLAADAIPELASIQPANQVRVTFPMVGGIQGEVIRTVEQLGLPDPYKGAAREIRITKDVDIPDVQSDTVLATAVGDLYLPFVSSDQMEGRLRIVSARGPGGIQNPYGPLPGDTIRIADYGPVESMDLRISTVTWTKDEVAIGILAEATFGLLGRAALERMRVPGTDTVAPISGRMFVHQSGPSAYEGALAAWQKRKPRVHAKKSAKGKKVTKAEKKRVQKWKANKPQPWDFGSPGLAGTEALLGHGRGRRRRRR